MTDNNFAIATGFVPCPVCTYEVEHEARYGDERDNRHPEYRFRDEPCLTCVNKRMIRDGAWKELRKHLELVCAADQAVARAVKTSLRLGDEWAALVEESKKHKSNPATSTRLAEALEAHKASTTALSEAMDEHARLNAMTATLDEDNLLDVLNAAERPWRPIETAPSEVWLLVAHEVWALPVWAKRTKGRWLARFGPDPDKPQTYLLPTHYFVVPTFSPTEALR